LPLRKQTIDRCFLEVATQWKLLTEDYVILGIEFPDFLSEDCGHKTLLKVWFS